MNLRTYTLNFDGSSKPNPGEMTSAYIIKDDDDNVIFSETLNGGHGTSNIAEYIGLYKGLEKAVSIGIKHIKIIGDSELVINQVNGNFRCNKPKLLHYRDKINELIKNFHTFSLTQVLRKFNKDADKMCRR